MKTIAAKVIEKCGGMSEVAKMAGVHITRVHRWTYPKDRGGTDGTIPAKHFDRLVTEARARGINLSAEDFFDTPAADPPRLSAPDLARAG